MPCRPRSRRPSTYTSTVRFDSDEDQDSIQWIESLRNKYSVSAAAVGRPVEIRAYAERIEIRQDGRVVGEHPRAFGRGKTIYDPWRYAPAPARKPGALRNGAPFKEWDLPTSLGRVRRRLRSVSDGDRQMVEILGAVLGPIAPEEGSRRSRRPAPRHSPTASARPT